MAAMMRNMEAQRVAMEAERARMRALFDAMANDMAKQRQVSAVLTTAQEVDDASHAVHQADGGTAIGVNTPGAPAEPATDPKDVVNEPAADCKDTGEVTATAEMLPSTVDLGKTDVVPGETTLPHQAAVPPVDDVKVAAVPEVAAGGSPLAKAFAKATGQDPSASGGSTGSGARSSPPSVGPQVQAAIAKVTWDTSGPFLLMWQGAKTNKKWQGTNHKESGKYILNYKKSGKYVLVSQSAP
jgi:hypothetical protein